MPRHLNGDAHEWNDEIPTVPICRLANPQVRGTGLTIRAGKEDPVELDSSVAERWGPS